nr:disease resistance protein tao1 [Quercus suber]
MAENAYCIAGKIVELLGSLIYEELSSAWGVQSDLKKLECTVLAIKAVLLDAKEKQESDHRLNHWLGQLKDVLSDAENVLDEFQYQILQKEVLKRSRSTRKKMLPNSIGSLKHLRYLDLSFNHIVKQLPDSICKLHSLQPLLLENCHNLERLPEGTGDIIKLRLFIVTTKHTCLSKNAVGCLNSLRSLWIWRCVNLKCVFEGTEEGRLTYLRTLVVGNCPSLTSLTLSIKHLTALETLIIRDCKELSLTEVAEEEDNQDLKLSLQNLMFFRLPKLEVFPQWLQGSTNTLQLIWIGGCENLTALPDWLPHLKSLQTLWIDNCPKLSSLPVGMEALTELLIYGRPDLSRKCRQDAHLPQIVLDEGSINLPREDDEVRADLSSY